MDTYLLDTNLVSVLYDAGRPNNRAVRAALAAFDPTAPQLVSAITIGELRFGLALSRAAGRPLDHIEPASSGRRNTRWRRLAVTRPKRSDM